MDNEMIERVAKAMCENRKFVWSNCNKSYWRGAARAAIKAMREPTEKIIGTMQSNLDYTPINKCVSQSVKVWKAAIDVIISNE